VPPTRQQMRGPTSDGQHTPHLVAGTTGSARTRNLNGVQAGRPRPADRHVSRHIATLRTGGLRASLLELQPTDVHPTWSTSDAELSCKMDRCSRVPANAGSAHEGLGDRPAGKGCQVFRTCRSPSRWNHRNFPSRARSWAPEGEHLVEWLFKLFSDNESFRRWLSGIFRSAYSQSA
jgi:hypothetical protein